MAEADLRVAIILDALGGRSACNTVASAKELDRLLPYDLRLPTYKSISHPIDFTLIFFNRNLGDRQPHFSRQGIDQVGAIVVMEKVWAA